MGMDTLVTLGLSLVEAENQRITKCPRISSLKVTHCVEAIKKIRACEIHRLEATVEVPFTSGPHARPTSKPFDLSFIFGRLGWK